MNRSFLKTSLIRTSLASLLLAAGVVSFGAGPATTQSATPTTRAGGRAAAANDLTPPVTQSEWEELLAFMDTNSPKLVADIRDTDLPMTSPSAIILVREYRSYKTVRENFPEVAKLREARFKIEDDIYDLIKKAKQNPAQHPNVQSEIHAEAELLVQNTMDERVARVKKLSELLNTQETQLNNDRAKQEQTVNQRTFQYFQQLGPAFKYKPATRPSPRDRQNNSPATKPATVPSDPPAESNDQSGTVGQVDPIHFDKASPNAGDSIALDKPGSNDATGGLASNIDIVFAIAQSADAGAPPTNDGQ